jgi:hypothetical protein
MRNEELYKLKSLIEEAKKIDDIISLHKTMEESDFMVSQYEAKKTRLISDLIDELVSPDIQSPQSFSLIQRILIKFYPDAENKTLQRDEAIEQLAAFI